MILAVHKHTIRHRQPPAVRENRQLWCLLDVGEVANQLAYIDEISTAIVTNFTTYQTTTRHPELHRYWFETEGTSCRRVRPVPD